MSQLHLKTYTRMTHCHAGHAMTDENTYFRSDNGYPQCRACHAIYSRRSYARRKAETAKVPKAPNKNPLTGISGQSKEASNVRVDSAIY
jgi:hypothetical protein